MHDTADESERHRAMFDEDNEKRFPRITLWQFLKGAFGKLLLLGGWIAEFYMIGWLVDRLTPRRSDNISPPDARIDNKDPK